MWPRVEAGTVGELSVMRLENVSRDGDSEEDVDELRAAECMLGVMHLQKG